MKLKKALASLLSFAMMLSLMVPVAEASALSENTGVQVLIDGEAADTVAMTRDSQPVLSAEYHEQPVMMLMNSLTGAQSVEETYQWQFLYQPDVASDAGDEENGIWVDIYGETKEECVLSYAKVANMLNNADETWIRCEITRDGEAYYSDPKTVEFQESEEDLTEPESPVETLPAEDPADAGEITVDGEESGAVSAAQVFFSMPEGEEDASVSEVPPTEPTDPNAKPADPAEPADPDTKPTDPGTEPTDPAEPTDPDTEPTDPNTKPTDPVEPTEPTNPTEPTDPVDPGFGVEPSDPEVEIPDEGTPGANGPEDLETYTITVEYKFADGQEAAPAYRLTLPSGQGWNEIVTSPEVVGYAPDQSTVEIKIDALSEDTTYTVTYYPAEVEYTVVYYWQNVEDDEYTEHDRETMKGYTESQVSKVETSYEGMYQLPYEEPAIAADGSTVVEVYYDRYYYLLNFDLDGGWGVEPIYARYGTDLTGMVGTPEKPGYTFDGWQENNVPADVPGTMPAENHTLKAVWRSGNAQYTVVRWIENANDDKYSFYDSYTEWANAGDSVTVSSQEAGAIPYFTYKESDTADVAGDGSTVINVYYSRNVYTLTFRGDTNGQELTCTQTEHTHSNSCCKYGGTSISHWWHSDECCTLGLTEHEHSKYNGCYKVIVKTITAKYEQSIKDQFPIMGDDGKSYAGYWWDDSKDTVFTAYVVSLDAMPGANITFDGTYQGKNAKIYYYLESLDNAPGTHQYSGKYFDLDRTVITVKSGNLTIDEEFHNIEGFSRYESIPEFDRDGEASVRAENYMYYTRNDYQLSFYNYNEAITDSAHIHTVQYQGSLQPYNFTPDYPSSLEAGAYEFAGWYTTPQCYEGSEVDFGSMTMPASNTVLYAKWVPVSHTVKVYQDKDAMTAGNPISTQEVAHGSMATAPDVPTPPQDRLTFIGWFYMDGETEKAFSFEMPIRQDMKIYAKWSFQNLIMYTVRYVTYEEGKEVEIAEPTTGGALFGTTKTFDAKTGNDLYEGYRKGYFPQESSHSITMQLDPEQNVWTFVYEAKDMVPYTVQYLEKGTNVVLKDPKTETTVDAVVTEQFAFVEGYMPDAFQKTLVLSSDEEKNVITFWYTEDSENAYYQVNHLVQNIEGDDYTLYDDEQIIGEIGKEVYADPLTIFGFTYIEDKSNASGTVTPDGLVLNLYYDRIRYPFEVRYVDENGDSLAEAESGTARYQSQLSRSAKTFPGYELTSPQNQSIIIQAEDNLSTAVRNIITFRYREQTVTINYKVGMGSGTLSSPSDTIKAVSGTPQGSTPTAAEGYKFVGWYKDEDCTLSVDADWVDSNNKLTPQKNEKGIYESATYYAKFEVDTFDLTIEKTIADKAKPKQSFIFDVKDSSGKIFTTVVLYPKDFSSDGTASVTIYNVPGGNYTVTERTDWSWMYELTGGNDKPVSISVPTASFTNGDSGSNWLGGTAQAENVFNAKGTQAASMDALPVKPTEIPAPEDDPEKKDPNQEPDPLKIPEEGVSGNEM